MTLHAAPRVRLERFVHQDPYVDDRSHAVASQLQELSAMGFHGDPTIDMARKRRSNVDRTNPATAKLLAAYPAFSAWLDLAPTAAALEPLYHPLDEMLPNGIAIDPGTRHWFCNIADARGIRSRAAALKSTLTRTAPPGRRWLSLACGAARPVLEAAAALAPEHQPTEVVLVDLDQAALAQARRVAAERSVASVRTTRANVLNRHGLRRWRRTGTFRDNSFGVVEAVGLLEYLQDDWPYTYRGVLQARRLMAGAVTFVRNAYRLVERGGCLIVGNMLDSHPELGFTLNVVQWPHIRPRSVEATLRVLALAGISGEVTVVQPDDGVYALCIARKV